MDSKSLYTNQEAYNDLKNCSTCPRSCNANRLEGPLGYCKTDAGFNISSICIHKGEEPVISGSQGICNVFFGHCNLQCIYCQNYQISDNNAPSEAYKSLDAIVEQIIKNLDQGCRSVGFVSASHMVPQMILIINALQKKGKFPYIIYNSNGYDKVETLRRLEGIVDVYLPDFKYAENEIGKPYSDVTNYFKFACLAIKEMYRQMGPTLITDGNDIAARGMIIRHLVLPGHVSNSLKVLEFIAHELSNKVSISLMAQYHPVEPVKTHLTLGRTLKVDEYNEVANNLDELGFVNGWVQGLDSNNEYLPDFNREHPFDKAI